MCSVGDVTGIDVNTLKPDEYECMDCHNTFNGMRITGVASGVQLQNIDLSKIDIRKSRM